MKARLKAVAAACGVFVLGLVIVFLFFEVVFRVGGFVYRARAHQRNAVALKQQGAVRILCLGESTTEMGGENSYPRQLERILNARQNRVKFAVINGGLPGGNTSLIADQLPDNIKNYRPDIVVLMMGINDMPVRFPGYSSAVANLLGKSRLVRFVKSLWDNEHPSSRQTIENPFVQKDINPKRGDEALMASAIKSEGAEQYDKAIEYYKELVKRYEPYGYWPKAWFIRKVGDIYQKRGQYKNYLDTISFLLHENPQDAWALEEIETSCRDKKDDAAIIAMLNKNIQNKKDEAGFYQLLGNCYSVRKEVASADKALKKAKSLRLAADNPLTRENYRRTLKILKENGIQAVAAGYVMRPLPELTNLLDGLEGAEQVILVDNEKIFKQALEGARYEDYFIDRFAGDFGHCTPKGNHLLAENIAKAILGSRL